MTSNNSNRHDYQLITHPNDGKYSYDGRDVVSHMTKPPAVYWPGGSKVALSLILDYEEGGEMFLLRGDGVSKKLLSEMVGAGVIGKCSRCK